MNGSITEVNKDTFWELIAQGKEHLGGPSEWLMERLMDLGPEQAKKFFLCSPPWRRWTVCCAVLRSAKSRGR